MYFPCYLLTKELNKKGDIDLHSILPEKFLEIHYLKIVVSKKEILDQFYDRIQEMGDTKLTSKTSLASSVVKVLKTCLEEANIHIFTRSVEIIRCLFKRLK
jgi:hypothetical protein